MEAALGRLERAGLYFIPYGSRCFPVGLTHLAYPPAGLFVAGPQAVLDRLEEVPRIGVVGTRKATAYGTRATEVFTTAFVRHDIATISGMAFGIDGRAHEAALDAGGLTVAVMGCGADVIYPKRHRHLYERMVGKGLVMSELPPGCPPARWTFPHRNRLLAALADAVLVVEGSRKSGALQTAGWALELGRPVFTVPGPILASGHEGCNALLYDGAAPALDPDVMVEEFLYVTRLARGDRMAGDSAQALPDLDTGNAGLDPTSRRLLQAFAMGPCSVDTLVALTTLPARQIMGLLARLELTGQVRRAGPGIYIRAP
jgi:DNA processing protein